MDIEWKEGAVCFAYGNQVFAYSNRLQDSEGFLVSPSVALEAKDFQLNTIKQGDYIEASELDNEQKYNDAVEVFGLFGFKPYLNCNMDKPEFIFTAFNEGEGLIVDSEGDLVIDYNEDLDKSEKKRKLTYPQIMAIGELKRLINERVKSAPKIAPDLTPDLGIVSSNKYEREITDRQGNSAVVDVYDVLKAFEVTCPATQHALKKLLCSGLRGHKDLQTDLLEAKESITRAIELNG